MKKINDIYRKVNCSWLNCPPHLLHKLLTLFASFLSKIWFFVLSLKMWQRQKKKKKRDLEWYIRILINEMSIANWLPHFRLFNYRSQNHTFPRDEMTTLDASSHQHYRKQVTRGIFDISKCFVIDLYFFFSSLYFNF